MYQEGNLPVQQELTLRSRCHPLCLESYNLEIEHESACATTCFRAPGASSLDGSVGGTLERSMGKTGVGSYFVEESWRTSRRGLLRSEESRSNIPKVAGFEKETWQN